MHGAENPPGAPSRDPRARVPGARLGASARAAGFLRNLRRLHKRTGVAGLAELVLARALPPLVAYERMVLVCTLVRREAPSEIVSQRVRARDPAVDRLFARLAAGGEPEVPSFSPAELDERFGAGDELWLFHIDGEVAHLRWTMRGQLRVRGLTFPLADDERGLSAAVTLPGARRRGIYTLAGRHLRGELEKEGVRATVGAIGGFNRRFWPGVLRGEGAERIATLHVLTLAGRRWVRAVPATDSHAGLLDGRGWGPRRWQRAEDRSAPTAGDWDRAARAIDPGYLDVEMAAVKRGAHLDLVARWVPDLRERALLKTDLWEEGIGGDELLFTLAGRAREVCGVDVSPAVVAAATTASERSGAHVRLTPGDVRSLPLGDGAVDAVLSTSTLDHLAVGDRLGATRELRRVLSPGGVLILTCDNAANLCDRLLALAAMARLVPFPLEPAVSLSQLRGLVEEAGLRYDDHAYLVHGPRVLTTLAVRALRAALPRHLSGRAVARLLRTLETIGERHPRRMAAFVAVRATNVAPLPRPGRPG